MSHPICDHCLEPVRLEYHSATQTVVWTHNTSPIGRWSCPDGSTDLDGHPTFATVGGVNRFEGRK